MASKVTLRQKPISGNRQSLYLDFYPPIPNPETAELTRREFLNLFIVNEFETEAQIYIDANGKEKKRTVVVLDRKGNPKKAKLNPIDKLHNENTLKTANHIKAKRQNALDKPEIYSDHEKIQLKLKEKGEQNFVAYFKKLTDKRKASNYNNWVSAYNYLETFTNGFLKFADLDETFCNDFKEYLLTTKSKKSSEVTLSRNSAVSYFNKVKATMKQAYKDGYLHQDLNSKVKTIKAAETRRNFLTLEEVNSLVRTECKNPVMKSAALFSILTGLRISDIQKLKWGEVHHSKTSGYYIQFRQEKTDGEEVLPISEQAFNLLGERDKSTDKVFAALKYSAYENKHLHQWINDAGITKKITFHSFRHTFACLQLANGTDIYTVSKMLGHRELKTTQIYAKVIDPTKRVAADKIKLDL
ncbi:MAG: tyrosine-type recombinase/integrase [Flavisolibacter sp.]